MKVGGEDRVVTFAVAPHDDDGSISEIEDTSDNDGDDAGEEISEEE